MKEINELKIHETKPGEPEIIREGLEVAQTLDLEKITHELTQLKNAIDHDEKISVKQIIDLENKIGDLPIDIIAGEFPLKKLKDIPDLKINSDVWKEILNGNVSNVGSLTYILPSIAEKIPTLDDIKGEKLNFDNMKYLPESSAEHLAKYEGSLSFDKLILISDEVAEHLAAHKGRLFLNGLVELSDDAAMHLSKHKDAVVMHGLTSISDKAARYLAKKTKLLVDGNSEVGKKIIGYRKNK